jgi:hypothetical protein
MLKKSGAWKSINANGPRLSAFLIAQAMAVIVWLAARNLFPAEKRETVAIVVAIAVARALCADDQNQEAHQRLLMGSLLPLVRIE